ncbi:MAG: glycoside hydrolase family 10 protein, partial [Bacteroidota bacterium]
MTNCYRALTHVILLAAFSSPLFAQFFSLESTPVSPKREFRSVWLTTVLGLDWPQIGAPAQEQEQSLREIIRKSEAMGLNAVVFQVVSRGDAMYPSERLPWAPWLSGLPGFDPGWDPLAVAIEESHRLGMELHAWYNVYRIGDSNTPVSSTEEPLHVRFAHPEWVETVGNEYWLNPAFPELRDWLVENVREIVEKYDIDAIHFDFIRTSTSGYARDSELKQQYNPDNIQDIGDWRRENINKFVRAVYPAVKGIKPWVKVGSTPIGHYKATAQINWPSLRGYTDVFQDSRRWLQEEVHDYLAPQVYWAIGQSTDTPRFELLAHDWTNESYERHVYVGIAAYKPNVFVEIPA